MKTVTRLFRGTDATASKQIEVMVRDDNRMLHRVRVIVNPLPNQIKYIYQGWRKWTAIDDAPVIKTTRTNAATGEQKILDKAIMMFEGVKLTEVSVPDKMYVPQR